MAGELSCLATGVKAGGRRRFEQRGHKEEHFKQEVAEFTKVPRMGIRIGRGGFVSPSSGPGSAWGYPLENSEKRLEQESTEATENLSRSRQRCRRSRFEQRASKKTISKQELVEFLARHSRKQIIEQEQTEITENPLFPPFAPVQLFDARPWRAEGCFSAAPQALGATPRKKTRIGTSGVRRPQREVDYREYDQEAVTFEE